MFWFPAGRGKRFRRRQTRHGWHDNPNSRGTRVALDISAETSVDGSTHLVLTGEIDVSSTKMVRDAIGSAFRKRQADALVIDLENVTFIDSTGIAALISGRKLADVCHASYRVINANDLVQKVLEVTGTLGCLKGN
jgi:anti-sigma B factor antagonist